MRVSCVYRCDQIEKDFSDLIIFPEDADLGELNSAIKKYQDSVIVGAIKYGSTPAKSYVEGILYEHSQIVKRYRKVCTDMYAKGSDRLNQAPIVHTSSQFSIGLIVCADLGVLLNRTASVITNNKSKYKILCVPAHMLKAASWIFDDIDKLAFNYYGMNVLVWNQLDINPRIKSFATDTRCNIVERQATEEPMFLDLTDTRFI